MRLITPTRTAASITCESVRRARGAITGGLQAATYRVLGTRSSVVAAAFLPLAASVVKRSKDETLRDESFRFGAYGASCLSPEFRARYQHTIAWALFRWSRPGTRTSAPGRLLARANP